MTVHMHEFTCDVCGRPCLTKTTEAEANREFLESGIKTDENSQLLSACDDCYAAVMTRAKQMGLVNPQTSAPDSPAQESVASRNTPTPPPEGTHQP